MNKPLVTLALLGSSLAYASADYPGAIMTKYGLASPPAQSCALCHTNGVTGTGTVNTPIGKALRMRGMQSGNSATLTAALDQLATEMVDSDGDGVTDVAELMAATNPNVADATVTDGGTGGGGGGAGGGGGSEVPVLKYGCGASVVPELVAFAGLLLLRRRWR